MLSTEAQVESPVPVGPPTLVGTPTVGSTLSCASGGFLNAPEELDYEWLRSGEVIAGATAASYTLTAADLGRTIACRILATNEAGTGDATSAALYVSNPVAAAFTATPAPMSVAAAGTTKAAETSPKAVAYTAACKLAKSKRAASCTVSASAKSTRFTGSVRLQGRKTASASKASKSGKLTLTLRSGRALKKGQKVVLTIKAGNTTKVLTAKLR